MEAADQVPLIDFALRLLALLGPAVVWIIQEFRLGGRAKLSQDLQLFEQWRSVAPNDPTLTTIEERLRGRMLAICGTRLRVGWEHVVLAVMSFGMTVVVASGLITQLNAFARWSIAGALLLLAVGAVLNALQSTRSI